MPRWYLQEHGAPRSVAFRHPRIYFNNFLDLRVFFTRSGTCKGAFLKFHGIVCIQGRFSLRVGEGEVADAPVLPARGGAGEEDAALVPCLRNTELRGA